MDYATSQRVISLRRALAYMGEVQAGSEAALKPAWQAWEAFKHWDQIAEGEGQNAGSRITIATVER